MSTSCTGVAPALPTPSIKPTCSQRIGSGAFQPAALAFALGHQFFLTLFGIGVAEAQAPNSPPERLSVGVTATRSELGAADEPVSASVVTREQILSTPAQAIDDVLRTVVGVNLPDYASYAQHPTANLVSMRGLGGYARALVLRDGVPLNDPFFGYVQWNRVPLDTVGRVEVIRGAYSSTWGNYAMGGVINIVSRQPQGTEASIDAGYGSKDTRRVNLNGSLAQSDTLRLDANLSEWRTNGYNEVPFELRAPLDIRTSFRARTAEVTANSRLDSTLDGFLRVDYHEDNQVLGTPLSTNWQRNIDYAAGVRKDFADGSNLTLTAYHTDEHFWTANTGTPDGVPRGFEEYVQNLHNTPVKDSGISAVWSKRLSESIPLVSAGADFRYIDGQDVAQIFDQSGNQIRTDLGRGKQRFLGAFAQAEFVPIERLKIAAAVRYENWDNYDGFDGNPGGIGPTPDRSASSTDPRLSARYSLAENWALRAAGYKAFRAPNLADLYRGYSIPGGTFLPNSDLKPERLTGGEVGVDFDYPRLRGQITVYENTIRDLLTFRNLAQDELPPGFFFGTRNINAGKARTRGAEIEAHWAIAQGWNMILAYAYNDPKILDNPADPTTVGNTEGGIPRNAGSVELTHELGNGLKLGTRVRYVQGYFTDNAGTLPIDSYTIVDLSASYAITKQIEVYGQIQNLFDRTYIAQNSGNPTPSLGTPFTVFAGVRVALK
ncbi:MAG TPA: TonB-dependent receptor [Casimicrobiaceae bacterium]|nr:TonB-dependent receptor [Casimicrobiaceae bacterium]